MKKHNFVLNESKHCILKINMRNIRPQFHNPCWSLVPMCWACTRWWYRWKYIIVSSITATAHWAQWGHTRHRQFRSDSCDGQWRRIYLFLRRVLWWRNRDAEWCGGRTRFRVIFFNCFGVRWHQTVGHSANVRGKGFKARYQIEYRQIPSPSTSHEWVFVRICEFSKYEVKSAFF
jgi:hypothetical protein